MLARANSFRAAVRTAISRPRSNSYINNVTKWVSAYAGMIQGCPSVKSKTERQNYADVDYARGYCRTATSVLYTVVQYNGGQWLRVMTPASIP